MRGWHRSFCLGWDRWFRGSPEQPGLMLSLDRGGQCKGVAYPLAARRHRGEHAQASSTASCASDRRRTWPRWVKVGRRSGPLRAIAFVIDRKGGRYVGGLSDEQVADALARPVGHRGSMAEYLHNTVAAP